MSLPSPNLDDRSFEDLLAEAKQRAALSCKSWTDFSASDPGMALLEAFAYLTDVLIYRLNRVPTKAYIEFLRLMGTRLFPPTAASTQLRFRVEQPRAAAIRIPELTRVTLGRASSDGAPPVFVTARAAVIAPGKTEASVLAYHLDMVEAELVGIGTGEPSQWVRVKHAPVVAPIPGFEELIVAVESPRESDRFEAREHGGRVYRIWSEVESFAQVGGDRHVFTIDRASGVITFAPAVRLAPDGNGLAEKAEAMGKYPQAGREIRVWYARGGGSGGNVAPETLTVMKSPIPGISVTNLIEASGGAAAETVENAIVRGPQQLHALKRAVTARDFEMFAERNAGAVRAKAFTQAELWKHALPGTVEVLLVPAPASREAQETGRILPMADRMRGSESEIVLRQVSEQLQEVKPLGTRCAVGWVQYKTAYVKADIVVYRGESPDAVKGRVIESLQSSINPLPGANGVGWPFGEPLRASHIYASILSEAGVKYVESIRLMIDDVPDKDIATIACDRFQTGTWYATCGNAIFRSMNDGESWERTRTFESNPVIVRVHPRRPGFVAVVTRSADSKSQVYASHTCTESWHTRVATQFDTVIRDVAWLDRGEASLLLIATDNGLWEYDPMEPDPSAPRNAPLQLPIGNESANLGVYCVTVFRDARGTTCAAVAAQKSKGVYLSREGAQRGSFEPIGLDGEDVRVLAVQALASRTFLWAGLAVPGNEAGKGCFKWEMASGDQKTASGAWEQCGTGWIGGSCFAMALAGAQLLAATHHSGVVSLDTRSSQGAWQAPGIACGLPNRKDSRDAKYPFLPVQGVAASTTGQLILTCGPQGIFRSKDGGISYEAASRHEFSERMELPANWLFCSGEHQIDVRREDS